jgi:hypothetical protein
LAEKIENCLHPQKQGGSMQKGSIIQTVRKQGPNVWSFRWSEKNGNGRRAYRKRVIGTIEQYPDANDARGRWRPRGSNQHIFQSHRSLQNHCYANLQAF